MNFSHTHTGNGLQIIAIPRSGTHTVAVRLFFKGGSRYDPVPGCAHLLEHMLFQGSGNLAPGEAFRRIEAVGGGINAHTTREYLSLQTVTLASDLEIALEILAAITRHPTWSSESFNKEKMVILQEILQDANRPTLLGNTFHQLLFPGHKLAVPIKGSVQSLQKMTLENITALFHKQICSQNAVLVLCGDLDHEKMLKAADLFFSPFQKGKRLKTSSPDLPFKAVEKHITKDTPQAHLMLGIPGVGLAHPERSALKLIELALGMGASGRLYRRLREELGLVYSIQTAHVNYEDTGYLAVRASSDPADLPAVRELILYEFDEIRQNGLSDEELVRVKNNYAGTLARRFETNLSTAGILGIEALLHKMETFDQAVQRIQAVSMDELKKTARKFMDRNQLIQVRLDPDV